MPPPDVKIIPPAIGEAVAKCFEVQLSSPPPAMAVTLESVRGANNAPKQNIATIAKHPVDCMSTVIMQCSTLTGSLSLGFPTATFLKAFEKMLGERIEQIDSNNSDACGELLNIIFSGARRTMNEAGFDFQSAIPSTIVGKGLLLSNANLAGHVLVYDCSSEIGPFHVFLSLKPITA